MAWSYPVATFIRDTVYAASRQVYDLARSDANRKRFEWAVEQSRPMVVAALTEGLGLAKVALLKMFGVWGPLVNQVVETLVESVYQAMKAAANVPQVINPPAPETIVDVTDGSAQSISYTTTDDIVKAQEAEQAEPGNESMESGHAIGFHTMPYIVFPHEQAKPGDTQ